MNAKDFSHHVNALSKGRKPSPLKDIFQFMTLDGMVNLAGGLPHPSLFPYVNLEADIYTPSASLGLDVSQDLQHVSISKFGTPEDPVDLSSSLQYSTCHGMKWLRDYMYQFTLRVYKPAYGDFEVLVNSGNTDGWNKVVQLLCDEGEYIITERHTYPSAQAMWIPMGCKGVPVEIDGEGVCVDAFEDVLKNWGTTHPGVKPPHVFYTIPTGQNPTGCTMSNQRKQEIYALCSKYDLIIVEDDPYYFLQFDQYLLGQKHAEPKPFDETTFIDSLVKSFLHFDTEGRVIRLDTFSKTLAPGTRLGWFTANPLFTERLLRATEVTTQTPSGFSQAITIRLLQSWGPGLSGYLLWLSRIREVYETRRTWMCDALAASFDITEGTESEGYVVYAKGTRTKLFSFIAPVAGMFVWCKLHLEDNAVYQAMKPLHEDPQAEYEKKLWMELVSEKVLLTPGSYYTPYEGKGERQVSAAGGKENEIFFRLAFSMSTKPEMELGIERMAQALSHAWGIKK